MDDQKMKLINKIDYYAIRFFLLVVSFITLVNLVDLCSRVESQAKTISIISILFSLTFVYIQFRIIYLYFKYLKKTKES